MCIVCVEWQAGKLTNKEALRNLGEMIKTDDGDDSSHYYGVVDKIMDNELPSDSSDDEMDAIWHKETHGD